MTVLRISEVAEESSVPVSTLRYYERIGLVAPLGRSHNRYRVYDQATLDRLAFIGRAKRLGMTLDEVATLMEAWFAGDCEPVQVRLRAFITARIADLRSQITDDTAFEGQLERVLARLEEVGAAPERCGPDCGCDIDPLEATGLSDPGARACSLTGDEVDRRLGEWRQILALAERTERSTGGLRALFRPSTSVAAELARLCAAETACCPIFAFTLQISADGVVLWIGTRAGVDQALDGFFAQVLPAQPGSTSAG